MAIGTGVLTVAITAIYYYFTGSWVSAIVAAAIMSVTGFLLSAVGGYLVGLVGSSNQPLSGLTLSALVLSGLATGLSWLCYFRALQLGEASRVAPVDKLSVVFAIVLAGLVLREHLGWHHWVGGALVVAGAIVLAIKT